MSQLSLCRKESVLPYNQKRAWHSKQVLISDCDGMAKTYIFTLESEYTQFGGAKPRCKSQNASCDLGRNGAIVLSIRLEPRASASGAVFSSTLDSPFSSCLISRICSKWAWVIYDPTIWIFNQSTVQVSVVNRWLVIRLKAWRHILTFKIWKTMHWDMNCSNLLLLHDSRVLLGQAESTQKFIKAKLE